MEKGPKNVENKNQEGKWQKIEEENGKYEGKIATRMTKRGGGNLVEKDKNDEKGVE